MGSVHHSVHVSGCQGSLSSANGHNGPEPKVLHQGLETLEFLSRSETLEEDAQDSTDVQTAREKMRASQVSVGKAVSFLFPRRIGLGGQPVSSLFAQSALPIRQREL